LVDCNTPLKYSPRERVMRVIRHAQADCIPVGEIFIDDSVIAGYLDCSQIGFKERLTFINKMGYDIVCLSPQYHCYGSDLPAAQDLVFPHLENWLLDTDIFTFVMLDGIMGWGNKLWGFNNFMPLLYRSPLSFEAFVEQVEKLNLEILDYLLDVGINGVIIADDLAYQRGLITSPAVLRKYILPSLAPQVRKVNSNGTPVFFHSDGNINEIMDDIVEAGFSGIHYIDHHAGMDILDLQSKYGKQLCLWGTIDVEDIENVNDRKHVQKLQTVISNFERKGFILGTSCGLFKGIDFNKLMDLYETLLKPPNMKEEYYNK